MSASSSDILSNSPSSSCIHPGHHTYRFVDTQYHHDTDPVRALKTEFREVQVCKQEPPPTPAWTSIPLRDDLNPSVKVENGAIRVKLRSPSPHATSQSPPRISHRNLDCTQRSGTHAAERRVPNKERRHEDDGIDTPLAFVRARGQVWSREGRPRTSSAFYRHRPGNTTPHRHRRDAVDGGRHYNVFDEGDDVPYMPESLMKEHAEVIVRLRNVAPFAQFKPVPHVDERRVRGEASKVGVIRRAQTL